MDGLQGLRKSAGLNVEDRITLFVAADSATRAAVEEHRQYVVDETLAESLAFDEPGPDAAVRTVDLDEGRATLGVRPAYARRARSISSGE